MHSANQTRKLFSFLIHFYLYLHGALRKFLLPIYKPSRSNLLPSFWHYFLMKPMVFEFWYRIRAFWFLLTGRGIKGMNQSLNKNSTGFLSRVKNYNQSKIWEFYRIRTEKFMVLLRCIDAIQRNSKFLCIGPRNEAEILLLSLYGFPLKNITSIDLFSYSPSILCMDMHNLQFPDNTYDVIYNAWTLKYSYDLTRACSEIIRVAKPGAIILIGFSHTSIVTDVVGTPLSNGLDDLLPIFEPYIDWIYWKEFALCGEDAAEVSVIFRIRK